jgi:hypothetical protein
VNHIYDKTTPKEFPRPGMGVYDESTYEEHLQSDGAHLTWPTIIQRLCSPIPKKRDNVKANLKIISQPSSKKQKKRRKRRNLSTLMKRLLLASANGRAISCERI